MSDRLAREIHARWNAHYLLLFDAGRDNADGDGTGSGPSHVAIWGSTGD